MENVLNRQNQPQIDFDRKIDRISKRFKYLHTLVVVLPILLIVVVWGLFSFLINLLEGWGIIYGVLIFSLFAIFLGIPFILVLLWGIINSIQALNINSKNKELFMQNPILGEKAKKLKRKAIRSLIVISFIFIPILILLFEVRSIL